MYLFKLEKSGNFVRDGKNTQNVARTNSAKFKQLNSILFFFFLQQQHKTQMHQQDWLVIVIGTAIFWGLGLLVLPFTLLCKQNGGTARVMAVTTTFCAWLMYVFWYFVFTNLKVDYGVYCTNESSH